MRETNLYKKVWKALQIISVFIWGENSYSGDNTFFFSSLLHWNRTWEKKKWKSFEEIVFFFSVSTKRINKVAFNRRNLVCLKVFIVKFFLLLFSIEKIFFCDEKKCVQRNVIVFNVFFLVVTCTQTGMRLLLQLSNAWKNWYSNGKIYVWQIFPNSCETNS